MAVLPVVTGNTSGVVGEHCEGRPTTTLENLKEVAKRPAMHQHWMWKGFLNLKSLVVIKAIKSVIKNFWAKQGLGSNGNFG